MLVQDGGCACEFARHLLDEFMGAPIHLIVEAYCDTSFSLNSSDQLTTIFR